MPKLMTHEELQELHSTLADGHAAAAEHHGELARRKRHRKLAAEHDAIPVHGRHGASRADRAARPRFIGRPGDPHIGDADHDAFGASHGGAAMPVHRYHRDDEDEEEHDG
jgi:hypothetical protein